MHILRKAWCLIYWKEIVCLNVNKIKIIQERAFSGESFSTIVLYYSLTFIWATSRQNNKMACAPSKDLDQPGHRPVWSESSLSAWRTHWVHSEDSDQTGRMPRLIWVFAGRIVILLVLSWVGSFQSINNSQSEPSGWPVVMVTGFTVPYLSMVQVRQQVSNS